MTSQALQDELTKKYPKLLEHRSEMVEIDEYVKTLSPDDIWKLWTHFRDTYTELAVPRRATFVTMGKMLGLVSRGEKRQYEYVCLVCGKRYSFDEGTQCPSCFNTDKTYRFVMPVGVPRTRPLKRDEEKEREGALNDRLGGRR